MVNWHEWEDKEKEIQRELEKENRKKKTLKQNHVVDIVQDRSGAERALDAWQKLGKTDVAWEAAEKELEKLKKKVGIE